jgi:translation initiation factor IF-3
LSPVRLIDETGTMLGEIPTDEALRRARDAGLDLVEMDPNSRPPVCKILDYGKHRYNESKKKTVKHPEHLLKEIRLRPKTDDHDRLIKVNHAREFIAKGHKVQFTMMFRGRERAHPEVAMQIFRSIMERVADVAKLEREPKMEGRRMTMVVMPLVAAPPPKSGGEGARPKPKPVKPDGQPAGSAPPVHTAPAADEADSPEPSATEPAPSAANE